MQPLPADEEDGCEGPSFVAEADELHSLVLRIQASGGAADAVAFARVAAILTKYQEQPALLDPHLERVVGALQGVLRTAARGVVRGKEARLADVQRTCRLLQLLASLRGHKAVVKFFSHEAAELEPALALLQAAEASRGASGEDEDGGGAWETRSVLLLWLSILVLIPFDLASVDSSLSGEGDVGEPPLLRRLASLLLAYLSDPGILRSRAAEALSRLLSRPDAPVSRATFLRWAEGELEGSTPSIDDPQAAFRLPGAAAALAGLMKHASRASLAESADSMRSLALSLGRSPAATRSPLLRKLAVKLACRVGLLLLPPRLLTGRYRRGARSLAANLGAVPVPAAAVQEEAPDDAAADAAAEAAAGGMEGLFQLLLRSLGDQDTPVRWAAAKALARLAARLPPRLAEQVIEQVTRPLTGALDARAGGGEDAVAQGGLLALAELLRRGGMGGDKLASVVTPIRLGLRFDARRGAHSVGSHVRDAACFASWALARSAPPDQLLPHAQQLAPHLLACACLDREVNVRRAAGAAFQELAGRLGAGRLDEGVEAVREVDYFALGSRRHGYTRACPRLASLHTPYGDAQVALLLDQKVEHWDAQVRSLAAEALGQLVLLRPDAMAAEALPRLLRSATSPSGEPGARAGAMLALAALAGPLASEQPRREAAGDGAAHVLSSSTASQLTGLVPGLEAGKQLRGRGGELLRAASATLLGALWEARLGREGGECAGVAVAESGLRSSSETVQTAGARALGALARACFVQGEGPALSAPAAWTGGPAGCVARYVSMLRGDAQPAPAGGGMGGAAEAAAARRGAAQVLSELPRQALLSASASVLDVCIATAVSCARSAGEAPPPAASAGADAETRAASVRALAHLVQSCGIAEASGEGIAVTEVAERLLPALLRCLCDYSMDNRGDVGSWVREAAIRALPPALALLSAAVPETVQAAGLAERCVEALLQQAAEKIDRTRAAAAAALIQILCTLPASVPLEGTEELRAALLPAGSGTGEAAAALAAAAFTAPHEAFPRLVPLLSVPRYRARLMAGLLVSAGGLSESLGRAATSSLLSQLCASPPSLALSACTDLLDTLTEARGDVRVVSPALRTLEALLGGVPSLRAGAGGGAAVVRASALAATDAEVRRGGRDVPLLCCAAGALAQLSALAEGPLEEDGEAEVRKGALRALALCMAGPFPRVRRCAAEAAYLRLMGDAPLPDGEDGDVAESLLAATRWDGDAEEVGRAVAELHQALLLGPPPAVRAAGGRGGARAPASEHESYSSLVESAGY